ncbi:hypothetical protein [Trebonia kvetii]|uniref:hypothetical protein n=1 Tax=Trebonia kvetii TaxID=2480626 RepID=UPI0016525158|nr:hypothetical protein [Trebonia kvetii]
MECSARTARRGLHGTACTARTSLTERNRPGVGRTVAAEVLKIAGLDWKLPTPG